jgi:hypothetical protein
MLTRLTLIVIYPLLVLGRIGWALRGHDPLRRREPEGSCWIERGPEPPPQSYFADSSVGDRDSWLLALLALLARMAKPFARQHESGGRSDVERASPAEIPDEVYTLW